MTSIDKHDRDSTQNEQNVSQVTKKFKYDLTLEEKIKNLGLPLTESKSVYKQLLSRMSTFRNLACQQLIKAELSVCVPNIDDYEITVGNYEFVPYGIMAIKENPELIVKRQIVIWTMAFHKKNAVPEKSISHIFPSFSTEATVREEGLKALKTLWPEKCFEDKNYSTCTLIQMKNIAEKIEKYKISQYKFMNDTRDLEMVFHGFDDTKETPFIGFV